jgi:hypothetical protein
MLKIRGISNAENLLTGVNRFGHCLTYTYRHWSARIHGAGFQPFSRWRIQSWGFVPGWYRAALSALKHDCAAFLRAEGPTPFQRGAKPRDYGRSQNEG